MFSDFAQTKNQFALLQDDRNSIDDREIWCIFVVTDVFLFSVANCDLAFVQIHPVF